MVKIWLSLCLIGCVRFTRHCGKMYSHHLGCFSLCQRFRKFWSEFKWKGPFRFLPTGIFGITSGGGPLISVGIFRPKFTVLFLTNRFFALIREFGKGIKGGKINSYWFARFKRKMLFHFPRVFLLISDQSVWHNGEHPFFPMVDYRYSITTFCNWIPTPFSHQICAL